MVLAFMEDYTMIRSFLLAGLTLMTAPGLASNPNQIMAIQQAQIAKLQKQAPQYPEIDLLKLWIANRAAGNVFNPADGGALEVSIDHGVVTLQTPTGSHHFLAGMVNLDAGTYRVDVVVIPSMVDHNWTSRSDSKTKTASFYARVGNVKANVPAIETAAYLKTTTEVFNGTPMTSHPVAPALTFSGAPGTLEAGTHAVWMSFNPYPGAKKLQVISAVLRRLE